MTIFAICGFQSSGKDTIADYLVTNHGFKKLSFATALKDIVALLFDWPRDKLEGLTKEDRQWREEIDPWWSETLGIIKLTPRYVLQYFGTELFRDNWHQDIWVKVVERNIQKYNCENIVITDCRFPNEIEMLTKYKATIIHVYRTLPYWFTSYQLGNDELEEANKLHISEKNWIRIKPDYTIYNNGTIEELHKKIYSLL